MKITQLLVRCAIALFFTASIQVNTYGDPFKEVQDKIKQLHTELTAIEKERQKIGCENKQIMACYELNKKKQQIETAIRSLELLLDSLLP